MARLFVLRSPENRKQLETFLNGNWEAMAKTKKPLQVECSPFVKKRSVQSNRRLHKLLTIISEQAWQDGRQFSMLAWRIFYKEKFLPMIETHLPSGEIRYEPKSTADLDAEEFREFMDRIELDAIEVYGVDFT